MVCRISNKPSKFSIEKTVAERVVDLIRGFPCFGCDQWLLSSQDFTVFNLDFENDESLLTVSGHRLRM